MSVPPLKPCRYQCGQEVVIAQMPSGVWMAFSIEPVPFTLISPDIPAIVWRPDGQHLDAHTAPRTPRQAYPMHLCRPYRESRWSIDGLDIAAFDLEDAAAGWRAS